MANRTQDWLDQAKLDLDHAEESLKLGHYEWTCLAAQQAAEKSVKALYQAINASAWGHGIARLLVKLPETVKSPNTLIDEAKILDRHYIPARYPNGLINGTPRDNYTLKDAEEAIDIAGRIIEFCDDKISAIEKQDS